MKISTVICWFLGFQSRTMVGTKKVTRQSVCQEIEGGVPYQADHITEIQERAIRTSPASREATKARASFIRHAEESARRSSRGSADSSQGGIDDKKDL